MSQHYFVEDDLIDDDSYYVDQQLPTSTRRYAAIPQGASVRVHQGYAPNPVPRRTSQQQQYALPAPVARRRTHWLTWAGGLLFFAIFAWAAITVIGTWWQSKWDDFTYGNPRTYQTDAAVGHNDSITQPSHFLSQNLKGQIVVVEYPGGDISKAISYSITTLPNNDSSSPVTVKFLDVNRDSKLDLVIDIGDSSNVIQIVMFNNGTKFVARL